MTNLLWIVVSAVVLFFSVKAYIREQSEALVLITGSYFAIFWFLLDFANEVLFFDISTMIGWIYILGSSALCTYYTKDSVNKRLIVHEMDWSKVV
jgi:hypothetical protein